MLKGEKIKRINNCMEETERNLVIARGKYMDSMIVLSMEIEENRELGNDIKANLLKVDNANLRKERVRELEKHLVKLNKMLKEC